MGDPSAQQPSNSGSKARPERQRPPSSGSSDPRNEAGQTIGTGQRAGKAKGFTRASSGSRPPQPHGLDEPVMPAALALVDDLESAADPAPDGSPIVLPEIVPSDRVVDLEPDPSSERAIAPTTSRTGPETATIDPLLASVPDAPSARAAAPPAPPPQPTRASPPVGFPGPPPAVADPAPVVLLPDAPVLIPQTSTVAPEADAPPAAPRAKLGLRRPVVFQRRPRTRVRRVTRVVRHIDTWSVFKVAAVFNCVLYVVCLTAGVLLWNVAYATGTVDNVEKFFEQFGWSSFEFKGGEIYHNAWIAGLFVALGLTGLAVLLATVFNLITDLVGGVRVSVLEEEVVAKVRKGATGIDPSPTPRHQTVIHAPPPAPAVVAQAPPAGPVESPLSLTDTAVIPSVPGGSGGR